MHTVIASRCDAARAPPSRDGADARVAVAGATGYTGQELLRAARRAIRRSRSTPAMSSGAASAARRLPALARIWDGTHHAARSPTRWRAKPTSCSSRCPTRRPPSSAPALVDAGVRVIDLSGAFRLRDAGARARWYPETHALPAGRRLRPHRARARRRRARAAGRQSGLLPDRGAAGARAAGRRRAARAGADIIVDAKSGVSGAGKTPTERTHFSEVHGSLSAYGVFDHRHGAEIEQGLGRAVTFTPHLVPLDRGILATIYVRVAPGTTEEALGDVYERAYARRDVRAARRRRRCRKSSTSRTRISATSAGGSTRRAASILVSVIDNLVKGASGQAVQNMNVMLGLDERRTAVTGSCSVYGRDVGAARRQVRRRAARGSRAPGDGRRRRWRAIAAAARRSSSSTAAARKSTPR